MNKVAAVVLNYKNYKDTIECVDSLLLQKDVDLEIIIVDNNSGNESVEVLQKKYGNNNRITLLPNDKNLGFNGGNNVGIRYAYDGKGCEFILVINNDTILPAKNIMLNILEAYSLNIAVISANVIGTDGRWQTPAFYLPTRLKLQTAFTCFSVLVNYIFPSQLRWLTTQKRKYISNQKVLTKENIDEQLEAYNYKVFLIQGSAFMLTPDFFKFYKQLYQKTFLYWEEICLSWYLHKAGLQTTMANNPPIIHKGNRSFTFEIDEDIFEKNRKKQVISGLFKALPLFFMSYKMIDRTYNN